MELGKTSKWHDTATAYLSQQPVTDSNEQSPTWEVNRSSADQEIHRILWNPNFITAYTNARHLSLSWKINPTTVCIVPVAKDQSETLGMFCNIVSFYGEESLASRPMPPVGGPNLSAIGDHLCNIAASTHHI